MNQSKVAVRYAKAFYESCAEQNKLEEGRNDIQLIAKAIKEIPDFRMLLDNPIAKPAKKTIALKSILSGKVSELTINFISLIVTNRRETELDSIARNFLHRYKAENNIGEVILTSAKEMQAETISKITGIVESSLNIKAEVETKTDPSLIGGFVLRVEDIQFDSSIATKLKNIKKTLLN